MVPKRSRWAAPDIERLLRDLKSSDEEARGDAVRGLCPCHAGWDAFEQQVGVVLRSLKDCSREVRAQALHVVEDAARMQIAADLSYYRETGEVKMGEKRALGFRSIEQRLAARRDRRIRKRKWRQRVGDEE